MESDQRLTPLPVVKDQLSHTDYPSEYPSSYEDTLERKRSLRQYFNVVYKRAAVILAITILVTAAVSFYSYRQPSIYQAQVKIIIQPRKPEVTLKEAINISVGDDQKYAKTQLQLLQDPELMKRVVIALGMHRDANLFADHDRGIFTGIRSFFSGPLKAPTPESSLPVFSSATPQNAGNDQIQLTPEENARAKKYVRILMDGFKVEQVEGTNILTVNVQDSDPELAAKVVYKVAELFIEEDAELETAGTQKAFKDLGSSIEELKLTIAKQETDLIDYMRSSGLPLQEKGQDLNAARLGGMSEAWIKAMESRRQIEARYNAAVAASKRGQGMNIPDLYENKIFQDTMRLNTERRAKLQDQIREIDKQIQDAETQRDELLVTYTPEYKKVKEREQTIASLKAAKGKMETQVSKIIDLDQKKIEKDAVGGALVTLRSQLDSAKIQEAESQVAYDDESVRANAQGQTQTKLTTLKREIETNRDLLDTYTQRQKEQELALSSGRPSNIKIQNRAVVPDEPIGPNRVRNILIALLFSLGAGIGLAFLLEYLDDSVHSSEDVSRHLGLPTLALIPHYMNTDKANSLLLNGNTPAPSLVAMKERHSPMAEAYRHLRTSLLFSSAGTPPKTVLITSTEQSEGKTTTAINTAITLAQSGADVVIVDCDLRRPRLHSYFGLENTRGLTNYLSGDKSDNHLIRPFNELASLKVITSGPIPPNPSELLGSNEMRSLLQFLSVRFEHVIIDSPPAISFADASILSTLVDGVVVVAMANKSSIHLLRLFKARAHNIGARIYGVVLNDLKAGSTEYHNYDYNYYSQADR
jgi:capsular exopolysaccharide synthesis family protein